MKPFCVTAQMKAKLVEQFFYMVQFFYAEQSGSSNVVNFFIYYLMDNGLHFDILK